MVVEGTPAVFIIPKKKITLFQFKILAHILIFPVWRNVSCCYRSRLLEQIERLIRMSANPWWIHSLFFRKLQNLRQLDCGSTDLHLLFSWSNNVEQGRQAKLCRSLADIVRTVCWLAVGRDWQIAGLPWEISVRIASHLNGKWVTSSVARRHAAKAALLLVSRKRNSEVLL
jgi:hypothetical protein